MTSGSGHRRRVRIPTNLEYREYDGAHTPKLWDSIPENWHCPGCKRSKRDILRWTTRWYKQGVGEVPDGYHGWMAGLHRHHDHSPNGRFAEVVICDQCNSADGAAKRRLELPRDFSFSPSEIGYFVTANAHDKHKLDFKKARRVYEAISH